MKRDVNDIYNKILEKLKASDNLDIIVELENSLAGAVTGSEALMSSAHYLLGLRKMHPSIYDLLKEQIKDYLDCCREKGLIIK